MRLFWLTDDGDGSSRTRGFVVGKVWDTMEIWTGKLFFAVWSGMGRWYGGITQGGTAAKLPKTGKKCIDTRGCVYYNTCLWYQTLKNGVNF